jgi:hypothetical protein
MSMSPLTYSEELSVWRFQDATATPFSEELPSSCRLRVALS